MTGRDQDSRSGHSGVLVLTRWEARGILSGGIDYIAKADLCRWLLESADATDDHAAATTLRYVAKELTEAVPA